MHRGHVVLPIDPPDHESPVFALARQPVLEDHHAGHHLGALEVGDVIALDAQGDLVETQRLLDLLQSLVARGQVAGAASSCGAPAPGRRCAPRSPARTLVAPLGHPDADLAAPQLAEQLFERVRCPAGWPEPGSRVGSPRPPRHRRAGGRSSRRGRRYRPPPLGLRPIRAVHGCVRLGHRRSAPQPRVGPRPTRSRRHQCRRRTPLPASPRPCCRAPRSSRSLAAFSKSRASEAAYICFSRRFMKALVWPAMKSHRSSTIAR